MKLTLKVWRQKNSQSQGKFVEYQLDDISAGSSFLEMLDILSEQQVANGEEPVAFDHDCREGICGSCSLTINGIPHGPENGTTAVSCTCATSTMARPSRSSHGVQHRFR